MTKVVVGICVQGKNILMGKRDDTRESFQDSWEFPGGKVESGETDERALNREFIEELGITVLSANHFDTIHWEYSNGPIEVRFYKVRIENMNVEEMKLNAHRELRWFSFDDAINANILPANAQVIKKLRNQYMAPAPQQEVAGQPSVLN
jgi:8-oxo-dGTP diphosphatase